MKNVTIIFPGQHSNYSTIACIAGAFEILAVANSYYQRTGKKELFTVQLAGVAKREEIAGGIFTVQAQASISSCIKVNLIKMLGRDAYLAGGFDQSRLF